MTLGLGLWFTIGAGGNVKPIPIDSGMGRLPSFIGAGVVERSVTGAGAGTLAALLGSGAGARRVVGVGAGDLPILSGAGAPANNITSTGEASLPSFIGTGAGKHIIVVAGAADLPSHIGSGVGERVVVSTGAGTMPVHEGSGVAESSIVAAGEAEIPSLMGSGVTERAVAAAGAGTIPGLDGAGVGERLVTSSGAGDLPSFTGSGNGTSTAVGEPVYLGGMPELEGEQFADAFFPAGNYFSGGGTFSLSTGPAGASIDPDTGQIEGVYTAVQGRRPCTITLTNGEDSASVTVYFSVRPSLTNHPDGSPYADVIDGQTFTNQESWNDSPDFSRHLAVNCTFRGQNGHCLQLRDLTGLVLMHNLFEDGADMGLRLQFSGQTIGVIVYANTFTNIPGNAIAGDRPDDNSWFHEDLLVANNLMDDIGFARTSQGLDHGVYTKVHNAIYEGNVVLGGRLDGNCFSIRTACIVRYNFADDAGQSNYAYFADTPAGGTLHLEIYENIGVNPAQWDSSRRSINLLSPPDVGNLVDEISLTDNLLSSTILTGSSYGGVTINQSGNQTNQNAATLLAMFPTNSIPVLNAVLVGETGAGGGTLPSFSGSGAGAVAREASGAADLSSHVGAGTAERIITAVGAADMPSHVGAGTGAASTIGTGAGAADLPSFSGSGVGQITRKAVGAASIASLAGDGAGTRLVSGTGAGEIASLVGSGVGATSSAGVTIAVTQANEMQSTSATISNVPTGTAAADRQNFGLVIHNGGSPSSNTINGQTATSSNWNLGNAWRTNVLYALNASGTTGSVVVNRTTVTRTDLQAMLAVFGADAPVADFIIGASQTDGIDVPAGGAVVLVAYGAGALGPWSANVDSDEVFARQLTGPPATYDNFSMAYHEGPWSGEIVSCTGASDFDWFVFAPAA